MVGAVLSLFSFCGRKLQCQRINAVAEPRWRWAIIENMSKMSITPVAQHLSPSDEKAVISFYSDAVFGARLPEAGPARTGVKLGIRAE